MVLSAEESIKALVLLAVAHGMDIPASSIRPFLKTHLARQATGFWVTLGDFLLSRWIGLITSLNDRFQGDMGPDYWVARKAEVAAFVSELNQLADADPGQSEIVDSLQSWGQMESLKQRGFYVDFRNEAWLEPGSVTKEDFAQVRRIAEQAVGDTEKLSQTLASMSPDEYQQLQEFLRQIPQISQAYCGPDSKDIQR